MIIQHCDVCEKMFSGRTFRRRGYTRQMFCSIGCVEAFEIRAGLPNGRVYESRPGWSSFPVVEQPPHVLPC